MVHKPSLAEMARVDIHHVDGQAETCHIEEVTILASCTMLSRARSTNQNGPLRER